MMKKKTLANNFIFRKDIRKFKDRVDIDNFNSERFNAVNALFFCCS